MLKKVAIVLIILGALSLLTWGVVRLFSPPPLARRSLGEGGSPSSGSLPYTPPYTTSTRPVLTSAERSRLVQFLNERRWPTTDKIQIGTTEGMVEVMSPYLAMQDSEEGNLILRGVPAYDLIYSTSDSSFLVKIYETPFEENRQAAERDLLAILGVPVSEACKLNIAVFDYSRFDSNYGTLRRMSFCFGM